MEKFMDFVFIVLAVAVLIGAGWALTRKKAKNATPIIGGGTPYDTTPHKNETIIPRQDGENQI
jgi:hypothetical protein